MNKSDGHDGWDKYIDQLTVRFKIDQLIQKEVLDEDTILSILQDCDIETLLKHQKMSPQFVKIHIIPIVNRDSEDRNMITVEDIKAWQEYTEEDAQKLLD